MSIISKQEFQSAIHPKENSRFILALLVCVPILIIGLIITYISYGAILIFIAFIAFSAWFAVKIFEYHLIANSIQVSDYNFRGISQITEEIKAKLQYKKEIKIFIYDEGGFNAFFYKFLRTKYIILTSTLVDDMSDNNNKQQLVWIIARFIGALQAKHFRLEFLRLLIANIEKIKIFNLFILPYERVIQYTGDNIGLIVCGDMQQVMTAMNKLLVGEKLGGRINLKGVIEQKKNFNNNFFSFLARLGSTHPHQIDRHLNLLAFGLKKYPAQFNTFIANYPQVTVNEINSVLPKY